MAIGEGPKSQRERKEGAGTFKHCKNDYMHASINIQYKYL